MPKRFHAVQEIDRRLQYIDDAVAAIEIVLRKGVQMPLSRGKCTPKISVIKPVWANVSPPRRLKGVRDDRWKSNAMIPAGALALVFAYVKSAWINKQSAGNETMSTIANNIREGAMAFLSAEYKKLAIFVAVVAGFPAYANNGRTDSRRIIALLIVAHHQMAGLSACVASAANVRTANAALKCTAPCS